MKVHYGLHLPYLAVIYDKLITIATELTDTLNFQTATSTDLWD